MATRKQVVFSILVRHLHFVNREQTFDVIFLDWSSQRTRVCPTSPSKMACVPLGDWHRPVRLTMVVVLCMVQFVASSTSPANARTPVTLPGEATGAGSAHASTTSVVQQSVSQITSGRLTITAGSEARKKIAGFLGGSPSKLEVFFIYFDLVVNDTEYHPGACPTDGRSAIDADTPLKWAVVKVPQGSSIHTQSNFARAYLALPLAFPRVYSLGLLDGDYVRYVRHGKYRMKVNVTGVFGTNGTSWGSLSLEARAELFRAKVREFLNQVRANSTSSWQLCYSHPQWYFTSFFWGAVFAPSYLCDVGDPKKPPDMLRMNSMLRTFYVLIVILASVVAIIQVRSALLSNSFFEDWGTGNSQRFHVDRKSGRVRITGNMLSGGQLPGPATLGGLLGGKWLLGKRAFFRINTCLKFGYLTLPGFLVMFVSLWPLSPHSSVKDDPNNRVLVEDTFIECYTAGGGRLLVTAFSVLTLFLSFWYIAYIFIMAVWDRKTKEEEKKEEARREEGRSETEKPSEDKMSAVTRSYRPLTAAFSAVILFLRTALSWPGRANSPTKPVAEEGLKNRCLSASRLIGVFMVAVGVWIGAWIVTVLWCSAGLLTELFVAMATEPYIVVSNSVLKVIITVQEVIILRLLMAYTAFTASFEIVSFITLTFIGLYINYPLRFFTGVSWITALLVEVKNALDSYRSPLLVIWKKYTEQVKATLKDHDAYEKPFPTPDKTIPVDCSHLYLKSKQSCDTSYNWGKFLHRATPVYFFTCLQMIREPGWTKLAPIEPDQEKSSNVSNHLLNSNLDLISLLTSKFSDPKAKDPEDALCFELQYLLKVRLARHLAELVGLLTLVLTVFTLLFGFEHLFSEGLGSINSIIFQLMVIPAYTFYRTSYSSPPLNESQLILADQLIKAGLEKALQDSMTVIYEICVYWYHRDFCMQTHFVFFFCVRPSLQRLERSHRLHGTEMYCA